MGLCTREVDSNKSTIQSEIVGGWRAGTNCKVARYIRPRAKSSFALLQQTLGGIQASQ